MLPSTILDDARPESGDSRVDVANLPGGAFLEGQWQTAGMTLEVADPQDGLVVGHVCVSTAEDVKRAIGHIHRHLQFADWPLRARREALEKASRMLGEQAERFAAIIAAESSKTIVEAEREVRRCRETLRLSAAAAEELVGETLAFEDSLAAGNKVGWYSRKPVGIVAAITPFNDPLNLVAHKLGPALIGGNGVVLKPSGRTPLSGLALVQVLLEAGVPSGRIAAIVTGGGVSEALITDERVDLISFTGGPVTADRIAAAAGAKKILSELGGNNATIVCADADPETAAESIVAGAFGVAGQNCLSVQRVYAHISLFNDVLAHVVRGTKSLTTGPKLDRATDVGPMISEAEARRVEEWVAEATAAGGTLHAGGKRRGAYYEPTVLTDVPSKCRVIRDEVFGPVVSILPFIEVQDAIYAANNSDYGLQAGVFTRSIDQALAIADKLHVGAVVINETSDLRIDSMPFGGFKKSGVGREGVRHAVREMTEPKNTIINLGEPPR
ncbi:aldehyde dehydrogenase family protein [Arthrobacter cupressi]|uniref:Acyl-CoA reductase n=1 Tax=Arthrobacter cupressi TaxID=1045773 RepID=A0A1G8W2H1_9MICC|nr:aldehyde dehydrogenase family protein [Arthrobacter cupressi]NYD78532.1 acyl-CoA reductase-like NAD-dependent aldehyde dehydrogenase [Arthrobacter cupressi]SDJ72571.1 Acyl-CoA reductase [Arthrobacter cupressi]